MAEMTGLPFNLADFRHGSRRLQAMNPAWAARFGEELARIDPWLRLGYSSRSLCQYLSAAVQGRVALAVLEDETPAACLTIRPDWLRGPLLECLAVLPEFQGGGLGREIIRWLAGQASGQRQGNLWTLCAEFNLPAREFYARQGFATAGTLPDLIGAGETEILLRLRLNRREAGPVQVDTDNGT